jgi:hypothetical protein
MVLGRRLEENAMELPALTLLPMPFLELIGDRDIAYLTTATAAALVNLGRDAEAHALLQAQWPRFNHTGPFEFALRELRALTEPGVIQRAR